MPSLALRPCPRCGELTHGGLCRTHRKQQAARRGTTVGRGYDADWKRLRLIKLEQNPLCEECRRNDRITLAQEVDHICPISAGGERLDPANLQSLCKPCHSRKTLREQREGLV